MLVEVAQRSLDDLRYHGQQRPRLWSHAGPCPPRWLREARR